ncbi:MAG: DUF87 domain-containing protein, partial [Candidatus Micrarchaeota archaeon]|nr:DUF87 domain-containing protein [Candidatus Micrarchaeota archaeon]
MADELGTVISDFEGPSTTNFSFVVSGMVRKGQFVKSEMEDGTLVGMVTEISRANRYFERAESVAEYDRAGPIVANFPISEWEYTVAKVRALGVYKEGKLLRSLFPASPGSKVLKAEDEMLKEFLGFEENGVNLGILENHGLEAKLNLDSLLQKHLAILAMSGAGKSYLASVLIEELLDRKPEHGRLAVIVVDIHGEYLGFKSGEYAKKTTVIEGKDIRIALHKVSSQMLAEFVPHLSAAQKRDLPRIMSELKAEKKE